MKLFSFETQIDTIHVMFENSIYYFLPNRYVGSLTEHDVFCANSMEAVYAIMENVFEIDMNSFLEEKNFKDDLNDIITQE